MRTLRLIAVVALVLFSACNEGGKATSENFTTAINRYLEYHGRVCTVIGPQFPVDIPRSQQSSISGKLSALHHAGLVSETDTTVVVHGLMDALRGPSPPQPVRHYALTAEGEKYIQEVSGAVTSTSSFCYGQKTVDSITHWTMGSQSAAEATYTYRIVNLAAWAQRPDVQQAFPDIQATLSGTTKTEQIIGLQLTDRGWEVPGS
ncbi:MAG: hypothetical protein WDN23_13200 [Edaphobacter sp.]